MAIYNVNGHRVNLTFLEAIWPAWIFCEHEDVRKVPRNMFSRASIESCFFVALFMLPILYALSYVPFIWPEMVGGFVVVICFLVSMNPYEDCVRALFGLITASLLLHFKIRFGLTVFTLHIEPFLYQVVIICSGIALCRRFYNFLCWWRIDSVCDKYGVPRYDQQKLIDNYIGFKRHVPGATEAQENVN